MSDEGSGGDMYQDEDRHNLSRRDADQSHESRVVSDAARDNTFDLGMGGFGDDREFLRRTTNDGH